MDPWILALGAFLLTVILILWRPGGIHEAVPALIGAFLLLLAGLIDRTDILSVLRVVSNAALTIISTFLMASVLEGAGFFQWVSDRLIERAYDSPARLYHLALAFSACLTLFLNNDGSILLGTPVLIHLVSRLGMPDGMAKRYLIGGCLVASAASAPLAMSNMANLEAMAFVGISLSQHLFFVAVPACLSLGVCWLLLFALSRRHLNVTTFSALARKARAASGPFRPRSLRHPDEPPAPHKAVRGEPRPDAQKVRPDYPLMWFAIGIIVLVRIGFFVASAYAIPTSVVAATGALVLLVANQYRRAVGTAEAVRKAPWQILGFAFGMDLVVFGLKNAGITQVIASALGPLVTREAWAAALLPGGLVTLISSLLNNHPGLIIGSLSLTGMKGLLYPARQIAYASIIMGSDIGSLLAPVGTLASLLWFHQIKHHGVNFSRWEYLRIASLVIPLSLAVGLTGLYVLGMVIM